MRAILLICLFAAAAAAQMPKIEPGVSQELAKWRAVQYSNISYKLNLTLEKMSPVLKGSIEIRVTQAAYACAEPNCPPLYIVLDWRKLPGHEKDSTISNVSLNGAALSVSPLLTRGLPQPGAQVGSEVARTIQDSGEVAEARASARALPGPQYEERDDHLIFHDGVKMGENVIKLDFTSPILTSGSAITRYIDKEDGSEYIYSLFVPSDASTAFPCFDQPDLKARFSLEMSVPAGWAFISNEDSNCVHYVSVDFSGAKMEAPTYPLAVPGDLSKDRKDPEIGPTIDRCFSKIPDDLDGNFAAFDQTQPISTYVFAFAAGPWKEFTDAGTEGGNLSGSEGAQRGGAPSNLRTLPTGRVSASAGNVPSSIYVRASQAKKFEPHFKDVARLRDEGIKYLESYFDYKFPFPKLDLVLIPEFPFGGMEHAGAIFLREDRIIFPAEPTKGDYLTRANLIFHEAAHQWFGDTVTMRWFDDLWLKEGFAEFMAYKTLEHVGGNASVNERAPLGLNGVNAWKVFYERNKQAAYATDSTRGTTPIYQKIDNLSAAKSAYGNIVYRKAPSFLRQAEFYLGEDKFQTAVRAFLKKHEFGNAGWQDLVREFEAASKDPRKQDLSEWADIWVKRRGIFKIVITSSNVRPNKLNYKSSIDSGYESDFSENRDSEMLFNSLVIYGDGTRESVLQELVPKRVSTLPMSWVGKEPVAIIPNYGDYGYGIFLLDDKSSDYVLKHIGAERDPFLRSMMWGALWDSVREAELDPRQYVELAIKQLGGSNAQARTPVRAVRDDSPTETDETIIQSLLGRVSTALNYYIPTSDTALTHVRASATSSLRSRFEAVLLDRLQHAPSAGQRITFYRAYVANASSEKARRVLKEMLRQGSSAATPLRTKDKFDIVTRLIILNDPEAPKLLAGLEKTETSDDAKRYAYAARAAFGTAENKAKFFTDFTSNKDISESWIESAILPFNSIKHTELTQPYLERALRELPNLKRTRKIFFINNWLSAWIGGQRDEKALAIVNKFLADQPNLDNDLRLKVLENLDLIERAVKIRAKYAKKG